jgi:hypothetical protein
MVHRWLFILFYKKKDQLVCKKEYLAYHVYSNMALHITFYNNNVSLLIQETARCKKKVSPKQGRCLLDRGRYQGLPRKWSAWGEAKILCYICTTAFFGYCKLIHFPPQNVRIIKGQGFSNFLKRKITENRGNGYLPIFRKITENHGNHGNFESKKRQFPSNLIKMKGFGLRFKRIQKI